MLRVNTHLKRYLSDSKELDNNPAFLELQQLIAKCNRTKYDASSTLKEYANFLTKNRLIFYPNNESPIDIALSLNKEQYQQETEIILSYGDLLQAKEIKTGQCVIQLQEVLTLFQSDDLLAWPNIKRNSLEFTELLKRTIGAFADLHHSITKVMSEKGINKIVQEGRPDTNSNNTRGLEGIMTSILGKLGGVVNEINIICDKFSDLSADGNNISLAVRSSNRRLRRYHSCSV